VVIERYLFREVAQSFGGVLSVLMLIFVSHRFIRYLRDAAAGELSNDVIAQLLGLSLATGLVYVLPIAFYLAVLLAFGRLYRDSEITAMAASGIGMPRLLQATAWFSVGFAAAALVLSLYVSPKAWGQIKELQRRAQQEANITAIAAGRFKEIAGGDRIFYAESVSEDRRYAQTVFVRMLDATRPVVLFAQRGRVEREPGSGDRVVIMEDGHRYDGEPGQEDYTITDFRTHAVRLEGNAAGTVTRYKDTIPTLELLASSEPRDRAELQWRLSLPLSVLLLGPLAVLLSRTSPRQGRYAKLFYAILVYFIYNNLMGITRELVEQGNLSPAIGIWPVHLAMALLVVGAFLYQNTGGWRMLGHLRRARRP